jgi:hypothetical protein
MVGTSFLTASPLIAQTTQPTAQLSTCDFGSVPGAVHWSTDQEITLQRLAQYSASGFTDIDWLTYVFKFAAGVW